MNFPSCKFTIHVCLMYRTIFCVCWGGIFSFSTFYLKNQGFGYFEEYLAPFGTVNLIWQHFSPQKVINFFLRYHVMKFEVDWLRFSLFSRGGLPEPPPSLIRVRSWVSLYVNIFCVRSFIITTKLLWALQSLYSKPPQSAPPQSADPASLRLALCYTPFGPIYYIQ